MSLTETLDYSSQEEIFKRINSGEYKSSRPHILRKLVEPIGFLLSPLILGAIISYEKIKEVYSRVPKYF